MQRSPIEEHEVRDGYRLFEVALLFDKTRLARPVGDRVILEGTLSTTVANRTIEWMIDQEKLENSFLSFLDDIGLGVDDHAVGHRVRAGSDQRFATRGLELDQAHPAHADGLHPRVPAESGNVRAVVLGGFDQHLAFVRLKLLPVDGDLDGFGAHD